MVFRVRAESQDTRQPFRKDPVSKGKAQIRRVTREALGSIIRWHLHPFTLNMLFMRKKYLITGAICWIALIALGLYFYRKPHTNVAGRKPDVEINASALYQAFQENESAATRQYVDKIIEVKGTVAQIEHMGVRTSLQLDAGSTSGGINCSLSDSSPGLRIPPEGTVVIVKGKCSGFLQDVNLVDCVMK